MKKKTFIVQLLDSKKPSRTSFTQVEDALFYSNDTDASLVFIPHEDTFDFESAKVVMFNLGDESLVERDMVVTTEDGRKVASYELPDEIISHWGEWVSQPVFSSGGEIYSGAIVPFSVERHLMHERPPKLTEVVTVTKFVEQSQELVNAMIQAEAQRITEEQVRQDSEKNRVQAESERSVKYESYAQQFNDVITDLSEEKDYHSLPEISAARGGFDTLGQRMDHTTAQLAQITHQVKTNGVGDSDNINAKIDLISMSGGGTLLLPDKEYAIDKQINYKPNVKIISQKGTLLKKKAGLTGNIFKSENVNNVELENLTFDGVDKEANGVNIVGGSGHNVKNVEVFECRYGIYIDDCDDYNVENCKVHDCTYWGITASATTKDCRNIDILNNEVYNCRTTDFVGSTADGVGINARGLGESTEKYFLIDVNIKHNKLRNNGRAGITTIAVKDFNISDNTSKGHTFNNSLGAGIIVSAGSQDGFVKDNICNDNYNGITVDTATGLAGEQGVYGNIDVSDNITLDNINSAIRNHNAPNVDVTKNTLKNGRTGIFYGQHTKTSNISGNKIEGFASHGIILAGIESDKQSDFNIESNFIENCGTDTAVATRAGIYAYQYKNVKLKDNTFSNNPIDLRTHVTDKNIELMSNDFTGSLVIPSSTSITKWEGSFRDTIVGFSSSDFNSDGKTAFVMPDGFTIPHFGLSYVPLNTAGARISSTTKAISDGYTGQKIFLLNINNPTITIKNGANTKNIGGIDVVLSFGQAVEYTYRSGNGWIQTSAILSTGL